MPDYINLELKVSSYIKKYICYHFSDEFSSINLDKPIHLNKRHFIGVIIINFLQKQHIKQKDPEAVIYHNRKIDSKITISLLNSKKKGEPNFCCNHYGLDKKLLKDLLK